MPAYRPDLRKKYSLKMPFPYLISTPKRWTSLKETGLLKGMHNLDITFSDFVDGNAPDIFYEGTDIQKDAIKDEETLREYLAILGEAYLYDTRATNRYYEQS